MGYPEDDPSQYKRGLLFCPYLYDRLAESDGKRQTHWRCLKWPQQFVNERGGGGTDLET